MSRSSYSLANHSLWFHSVMQNCKDASTIEMEALVPETVCLTKAMWGLPSS